MDGNAIAEIASMKAVCQPRKIRAASTALEIPMKSAELETGSTFTKGWRWPRPPPLPQAPTRRRVATPKRPGAVH